MNHSYISGPADETKRLKEQPGSRNFCKAFIYKALAKTGKGGTVYKSIILYCFVL